MTGFETDLRAWMRERAARVHASPGLLNADYRPRTGHVRLPATVGGGVAAAATAALAVVLSLTGGATNAFAGWTPQPTPLTPAQRGAAEAYCMRHVPDKGLPLRLIDARGPFTFLVYSNGATDNFCTVGPSFRNASGWTSSPPVRPRAGRLFLWTDHTSRAQGQSYGTMIAQVGADVRAVHVTLGGGTVVTATVEHGWAVAWWPGDRHLTSARLATPHGTHTQTFARYPCDVHACTGGPHGPAPGAGPHARS